MIPKLENRKWKVLTSEQLLNRGTWMNLRVERVQLPSGSIVPEWFVLEFPDWVNVIAITKEGQFVMEDQYRHALGQTGFELVAGVIDPGETPLEAAQRELREETGFGGGTWTHFMTVSPNPTNHTNLCHTFLATDVERLSEQNLEATEDIHVDIFTPEEVLQLLSEGQFIQALHAAPLWKYFAQHPQNPLAQPL